MCAAFLFAGNRARARKKECGQMEQAIGNAPYVVPQTLLIVDDNAINRGILDNIFSAYYMDGLETLQHLKRLDLLDEVPVFLITVESSDALMESGDRVRRIHDITQHMLEHTDWGEGLTKESMEQIALASVMHDVGRSPFPTPF